MLVNLHGLIIELQSSSSSVLDYWKLLFDCELITLPLTGDDSPVNIKIIANILDSLPPLPDYQTHYKVPGYEFSVYNIGNGQHIIEQHGQSQGLVNLNYRPNVSRSEFPTIQINLTSNGLQAGILEDVTINLLAPIARRHELFIIHATTVVNDEGTAILFVAPTKHGKTTSGLSMVVSGWQFLANDTSFIVEKSEAFYALISPGSINVRPQSFEILSGLKSLVDPDKSFKILDNRMIPRKQFLNFEAYKNKGKVTRIYFPTIGNGANHVVKEISRSVGLARLMEQSMDQWDQDTWEKHLDFLERLSSKVQFRSIELGKDIDSLPNKIEEDLLLN